MSCKPSWFRCLAPEQSFYEYKSEGKVPRRGHPKVSVEQDSYHKRDMGQSSCEISAPGLQLLSPWRREVLKRAPTTESDLSLISGVSSLNNSHFGRRDTQEGSMKSSRRPHPRGQLNVSVEVCEGFLKVFLGGVRNIRRHDLKAPCYFVQLSVIPQDNKKVNTLVTSMKHDRDPVFDEVFVIAPHTTVGRPRLLIEVMSIGEDHRRRLVGCMSFGIRPLLAQRKSISGWYYLLNDEIGRRKHFRVQEPIPDELVGHVQKQDDRPITKSSESSHTRRLLEQTYMASVTGSSESLDFTTRYRHDLTVSSTHSLTCSGHKYVRGPHYVGSRNSSRTSDDNTSGYSTCSSGLSARVKDIVHDAHQSACLDGDYYDDEGPSENWSFLAAFDNFPSGDITTHSLLRYRKGEESILYGQSEFIWITFLLYV